MKKFFAINVFFVILFFSFFGFLNWDIVQANNHEIRNPLEHDTIEEVIMAVLRFLQRLALIATPIVIVIAGFYFVTAGGNPEKIKQAKNMIMYALAGLAIILIAEGIVALLREVIGGN